MFYGSHHHDLLIVQCMNCQCINLLYINCIILIAGRSRGSWLLIMPSTIHRWYHLWSIPATWQSFMMRWSCDHSNLVIRNPRLIRSRSGDSIIITDCIVGDTLYSLVQLPLSIGGIDGTSITFDWFQSSIDCGIMIHGLVMMHRFAWIVMYKLYYPWQIASTCDASITDP